MKILILGLNYSPEPVGIGPFTTGVAEYLALRGHEVVVNTAPPYYPKWKVQPGFKNGRSKASVNGVEIHRSPIYVPTKPSGRNRLLHLLSFTLTSFLPVLKQAFTKNPDVVLCVAPSLLSIPLAWLATKLGRGKLWIHVQDFEVEAAVATNLLKAGSTISRFAARFEKLLLSRADLATTISPAMCRKLEAKGIAPNRVFEFRNWAEIDAIQPLDRPSAYRERWGITQSHVALYSGNIANKQGIEIIVEAAQHLTARDDLLFVICGNGSNRASLERLAVGCSNIMFQDLVPREELGELLGLATLHLLPQIAGAADLVLPSKLANMLASGRPVVATADAGTGLAIEMQGCGLVVPPSDGAALAEGIKTLIDNSDAALEFGLAARQRAIQSWSREQILGRLMGNLLSAVQA